MFKERIFKAQIHSGGIPKFITTGPNQRIHQVLGNFNSLVLFYHNNLSAALIELIVDLRLWNKRLSRLEKDELPKHVISASQHCKDDMMSTVLTILSVSTTENERSSSMLRRLKTYLRSCTLTGLTLRYLCRNLTPIVKSILDKMVGKQRKLDINL